ncbi:MAG: ComEC/Rec2 family competence protein, partial [Clostridia bacterium]|nr:ComEC/Rec2 family competence protein [Clostridia bacterium]
GGFHVAENVFYHDTKIEVPRTIQTRVYSVSKEDGNYMIVYSDSCYFDNKKQDTTIKLYIYDNENLYTDIEVGKIIKFSPKNFNVYNIYHEESVDSSALSDECRYVVTADMDNISIIDENKLPDERIRDKIKSNLTKGLSNKNSELVFSAMFGDKTLLSEDVYNDFKLSGVAHLLAVSGLHVGILAGVLFGILKLFKAKPLLKLIIISPILIFYAYLCGFSISVVRAVIMTIVMLLSSVLFAEYDSLSSLSLAGIILFFLNPFVVFDVGFILSFGCVFGIIMFTKPISRFFNKMKFPKFLSNSLAMSTATTIALIIPLAYFFNNLNIVSILANIILIPIFSIVFTIAFVLSILSLVMPFITNVLVILNPIFDIITVLAKLFGNLPISNFATIHIPMISILLYFALLLVLSCINISKLRTKLVVSLPVVAVLIISMVVI